MLAEPLDELYLKWLYSQVANPRARNKHRTYWELLRVQFTTEFIWLVPNDDNRVEDGRLLRIEFMQDCGIVSADENWLGLGCSFLEMAIALSRRLSFEGGGISSEWFWVLMRNLDLQDCTDATQTPAQDIDSILNRVIWRTYRPDGSGGLFPLKRPSKDQRTVEIWYQLQAYLLELGCV
jgi:hypothetical protein